jgi:hypothetical protein
VRIAGDLQREASAPIIADSFSLRKLERHGVGSGHGVVAGRTGRGNRAESEAAVDIMDVNADIVTDPDPPICLLTPHEPLVEPIRTAHLQTRATTMLSIGEGDAREGGVEFLNDARPGVRLREEPRRSS